MSRDKIAKATPVEGGNKVCNACQTRYDKEQFRREGLYFFGLYYMNCSKCESTITVRSDYFRKELINEQDNNISSD